MTLKVYAALSGILFCFWPFCLKKSGIGVDIASVHFTLNSFLFLALVYAFTRSIETHELFYKVMLATVIAILVLLTIYIGSTNHFTFASYTWIIFGSITSAIAITLLNYTLSKVSFDTATALFTIMIVTQALVPAVLSFVHNKGMSTLAVVGYTCAIVSVAILSYVAKTT